jgi:hypothetical protein
LNWNGGYPENSWEITNGYLIPVYTVAFDYQPPDVQKYRATFVKAQPLQKGMVFRVLGGTSDGTGFIISNPKYNEEIGFHIQRDGHINKGWINLKTHEHSQQTGFESNRVWTSDQLFNVSKEISEQQGLFKCQILYSGIADNTLKAIYREFVDNLIRPGFTQELQYDLSESKTFSFRNIDFEIIEATNSFIKYRITSDNGLQWMPKR